MVIEERVPVKYLTNLLYERSSLGRPGRRSAFTAVLVAGGVSRFHGKIRREWYGQTLGKKLHHAIWLKLDEEQTLNLTLG
jgi:hypothetical protein